MLKNLSRLNKAVFLAIFISLITLVFLLTLNRAMVKKYSHDENQFVASASLLSSQHLLPYRDYPYFHTPNLVFIYAVLYKITGYKLLYSRLFSVICATLSAGILFLAAFYLFSNQRFLTRLMIATAGAVLLVANPLYEYTSGLAWNHDLPVLLTLLAVITFLTGLKRKNSIRFLFLSGVLAGLSIGTRATFATALVPFLIYLFWTPEEHRLRLDRKPFLAFGTGVILSLLPSIVLFLLAPRQFIFGNLSYAWLNTLFRQSTGFDGPLTLSGKIDFLFRTVLVQPANILLFLSTFLILYGASKESFLYRLKNRTETGFLTQMIVFVGLGAFLPTPSFYQYFYAAVPFAILGCLIELSNEFSIDGSKTGSSSLQIVFVSAALLSAVYGLRDLPKIFHIEPARTWFPLEVNWDSAKIYTHTDPGMIMTLSPIYAVEAGRMIYPELATGPFAWRVADLLTAEQRQANRLVNANNLDEMVQMEQPAGIVVGYEADLEGPLIEFAVRRGYRRQKISDKLTLWVPK